MSAAAAVTELLASRVPLLQLQLLIPFSRLDYRTFRRARREPAGESELHRSGTGSVAASRVLTFDPVC